MSQGWEKGSHAKHSTSLILELLRGRSRPGVSESSWEVRTHFFSLENNVEQKD